MTLNIGFESMQLFFLICLSDCTMEQAENAAHRDPSYGLCLSARGSCDDDIFKHGCVVCNHLFIAVREISLTTGAGGLINFTDPHDKGRAKTDDPPSHQVHDLSMMMIF